MPKLEVGKTYKNQKGETVKILSKSKNASAVYPFQGDDLEFYTPDGAFTAFGETEHDLVTEVKPESRPDKEAPNPKELAGWFRKIADALESDEYSEFKFHHGELTIDQRQRYPESDYCSTEVAIDMSFELKP